MLLKEKKMQWINYPTLLSVIMPPLLFGGINLFGTTEYTITELEDGKTILFVLFNKRKYFYFDSGVKNSFIIAKNRLFIIISIQLHCFYV